MVWLFGCVSGRLFGDYFGGVWGFACFYLVACVGVLDCVVCACVLLFVLVCLVVFVYCLDWFACCGCLGFWVMFVFIGNLCPWVWYWFDERRFW